jgi:hypothetical protein
MENDWTVLLNKGEVFEKKILFEGKEWLFKLKRLDWYQKEGIMSNCRNINPKTKTVNFDEAKYKLELLIHSTIEAPFPKERYREIFKKLDDKIVDELLKEIISETDMKEGEVKK